MSGGARLLRRRWRFPSDGPPVRPHRRAMGVARQGAGIYAAALGVVCSRCRSTVACDQCGVLCPGKGRHAVVARMQCRVLLLRISRFLAQLNCDIPASDICARPWGDADLYCVVVVAKLAGIRSAVEVAMAGDPPKSMWRRNESAKFPLSRMRLITQVSRTHRLLSHLDNVKSRKFLKI